MLRAIQHGGILSCQYLLEHPVSFVCVLFFSSFSGIVHSYEFKEVTTTDEEVTYGMLDAYDHCVGGVL